MRHSSHSMTKAVPGNPPPARSSSLFWLRKSILIGLCEPRILYHASRWRINAEKLARVPSICAQRFGFSVQIRCSDGVRDWTLSYMSFILTRTLDKIGNMLFSSLCFTHDTTCGWSATAPSILSIISRDHLSILP